jgi:hypothetical protein|tara:strand:- start:215 stop:448 length:234 start_codon:yes stop_codon:yes gene_type:complete
MRKSEKIRHQMKSRFYYLFWGAATVAVVAGQLYVGTSYRAMAKSMNRWFEETIDIITLPSRIDAPPNKYYEQDMVVR